MSDEEREAKVMSLLSNTEVGECYMTTYTAIYVCIYA